MKLFFESPSTLLSIKFVDAASISAGNLLASAQKRTSVALSGP